MKHENLREHRARGRGRRVFWALMIAGGLVAVLLAVPGLSRERAERRGTFDLLSDEREALHAELISALAARELDPDRFERLEASAAELASRAVRNAYETARTLTPEQRAGLLDRWSGR